MVKNTLKTMALIIVAWLWFPFGDPVDLIITTAIIERIGMTAYTIISVIFLFILYENIEGRGVPGKISTVKKEMRAFFK